MSIDFIQYVKLLVKIERKSIRYKKNEKESATATAVVKAEKLK